MRVLVYGGRDYADKALIERTLDAALRKHPGLVVISGGAREWCAAGKLFVGADWLAMEWARDRGVWCYQLGANWSEGCNAGPKRNGRMLAEGSPQAAIEFPGGAGTKNMRDRLLAAGITPWSPADG